MSSQATARTPPDTGAVIEQFVRIVGAARVLTDPADTQPFLQDWRGRYKGPALAVLMPGSTEEGRLPL